MRNKKLSKTAKKNLLDLNHDKYLQYYNTSIIISFTYIIGVIIGFLTEEIDYTDKRQLALIGIISIAFLGMIGLLLINFKEHIGKIKEEIRKL